MELYTNKFHLSYENEVNFWLNSIINKWIELNYDCPKCKKHNSIRIKNKKSLSNPIKLQCNNILNIKNL